MQDILNNQNFEGYFSFWAEGRGYNEKQKSSDFNLAFNFIRALIYLH